MNGEVVYRIAIAEIQERGRRRAPGYVEAVLAAGTADTDGVHWRVPLAALREVWARFGGPGLDLEGRGRCEGCGG